MDQHYTIETNWWQGESQTDISYLKDLELGLIAYMYKSKELFEKIISEISTEDFTFSVAKNIYEYLVFYAKQECYFDDDSKKNEIAMNIYEIYNIDPLSTLKILNDDCKYHRNFNDTINQKKENDINLDIFELIDFSKKRKDMINKSLDDEKDYVNIMIEDEYGFYHASYCNGIIMEIKTTYLFHLPKELCDTFKYTFKKMMNYIQTDNYDITMQINKEDSEDIQSFNLRKNIDKIEKVEKLISWANDNQINPVTFPRNRGALWEYTVIEVFDESNLIDIPSELFEIKKGSFSFNFLNNKIKSIPNGISNSKCNMLMLCYNKISEFPTSLYELEKLSTLCLHANQLKSLPKDIDKMKNLTHLTISNNPILNLPSNISNINTLEVLDMENTLIKANSLRFLQFENLERFSFNDTLLPYLIENLHRLKKIDTINLTHSKYTKDDEIIKSLGLEYANITWMEEKDDKGDGCVLLSKTKLLDGEIPSVF